MAGRTGYTTTPADFNLPKHIDDVFKHFDPLIGETRPTAANLPTAGNWVGRRITVIDTLLEYTCTALPGTWRITGGALQPGTSQFTAGWTAGSNFGITRQGNRVVLNLHALKSSDIVPGEGIGFVSPAPAVIVRFAAAFYGSGAPGMLELRNTGQIVTTGVVGSTGARSLQGAVTYDVI